MSAPPPSGLTAEAYETFARAELEAWRGRVTRPAGLVDKAARGVQTRINAIIPEQVHAAVTKVIEQMTRGILTGADFTTGKPLRDATLQAREDLARRRISAYRTVGATEGGVAGAGGFLLAAAEFPVLIGTKIKLLFDLAAAYGHSGDSLAERLYILEIFQLAFSSAEHRHAVYERLAAWDPTALPQDLQDFDWRRFQQEYRDYIDLAKLAQLIPLVGAPIGAIVNFRLLDRLGETAMNAYRMRVFSSSSDAGISSRIP